MSPPPLPAGKLPPELLAELLGEGPSLPDEVILGPGVGEDACAIELPAGTLVAATDPITLTGDDVAAYAVKINANDVAVTGVRPRWFLATVLLPAPGPDSPGCGEDELRSLFRRMRDALAEIDAALVGGHTEVTAAVRQPVVVGQMLGHAECGRIVKTGGMQPGDRLFQIGTAPIEGAAVLAAELGEALHGLDSSLLDAALRAAEDPGISVVSPALIAAAHGAVSLHDPTEGGLSSGLYEVAEASRVSLTLDEEAVLWFEPGRAVCGALGADPWGTLASGSLLAAFRPSERDAAAQALSRAGLAFAEIGVAEIGSGVSLSEDALPRFARDEVARVLEQRGAAPG